MNPLVTEKSKQAFYLIVVCIIGLLVLGAVYTFCRWVRSDQPGAGVQVSASSPHSPPRPLPSIAEIQQMVNDRGYKIKVDGMLCESCYAEGHSETQENWDLAWNEQMARETWPPETENEDE